MGGQIGVTGTPTVIINGKMIVGAQDISVFEQAIDAALGQ
jgi:protein-disulfide isomerase